MVNIELTDNEAELFKQFRQNEPNFTAMLSCGVFDVKKGQVILSFSAEGKLTDVDIHIKAFKKNG